MSEMLDTKIKSVKKISGMKELKLYKTNFNRISLIDAAAC